MKTILAVALLCPMVSLAQNLPEVKLAVESASPRAVEALTERSVARDYTAAWRTLAEASEKGSPALLDAYFVGGAKTTLARALADQKKTGTHVRYLNQTHNLKAVFYAPEGDVMELQDAAEYQMQIVSDDKVIHDEHVVVQYIVLMTPGADRWVIRQLQSVPTL
jgi:hypothetical protein